MAHVKAAGTTKGNRDSQSKRLGVKLFGGEKTKVGSIIIRQKGTRVRPGLGTRLGKDFTVYAMTAGVVKFYRRLGKQFVSVEA